MIKKALFALITLLLIFGALELVLWGVGVRPLASERDAYAGFEGRAPLFELDAAQEYWQTPPRAVRHSFNYQRFLAEKPANGFRVFVLGGSSAYGFPWGADQAFSAALQKTLQASYPEREVEVINAAGMSYGSLRLRLLSYELLQHEPDLMIVYSGHNEFVERDLKQRVQAAPLPTGVRAGLERWRLYSALSRLNKDEAETPDDASAAELIGLDADREYTTDVADQERDEAVAELDEHLRAIVRAATNDDVPIVLCTVPSNERNWRPNQTSWPAELTAGERNTLEASLQQAREANDDGDGASALAAIEQIEQRTTTAADAWYEKGRALETTGRIDDAALAYRQARDLDAQPGRALSVINETIRRVASEESATLVDVDATFRSVAGNGSPGFDLFEDYVHPKPAAHLLIARELWRSITGEDDALFLQALDLPAEFDFRSQEELPEAAQTAQTAPLLFNLAVVLENQGRYEEAMERYRRCVELDPGYWVARANLGRLLRMAGRPKEAADQYAQVLQLAPDHLNSAIGLGESLRELGILDQAQAALERAVALDDQSPAAWNALGSLFLVQRRMDEAERAFQRTVELDPENIAVQANLGMSVFFQGKFDQATTVFRAILDRAPDHPDALGGLGAIAIEQDDLAAAQDLFERALAQEPDHALSRNGLEEVRRRQLN